MFCEITAEKKQGWPHSWQKWTMFPLRTDFFLLPVRKPQSLWIAIKYVILFPAPSIITFWTLIITMLKVNWQLYQDHNHNNNNTRMTITTNISRTTTTATTLTTTTTTNTPLTKSTITNSIIILITITKPTLITIVDTITKTTTLRCLINREDAY